MIETRQPAVAGMFYPAAPDFLKEQVAGFLANLAPTLKHPPKAIIAPHAGYVYSGPVAARAYAEVAPMRDKVQRVIVLAPAHRYGFDGIAHSEAQQFRTPLGDIPVDQRALKALDGLPQVRHIEQAFEGEHSLEVHLPFLQLTLTHFQLVPLIVGQASAQEVAEVLDLLWGGEETLIVVSSDLSHFLDYETARAHDHVTTEAIEALAYDKIGYHDACGRNPISGLLYSARRRGMEVNVLDLRNSGDTAGSKERVVGYGAYSLS